jgi:PKD repeat protein
MKRIFTLLFLCGFLSYSSAQTVFQENFDAGIPGTWAINDFLGDNFTWFGTTNGYGGTGTNYLDGTEFAFVDSDADGNGIEMVEDLTTPAFDASLYTTLTLEFDQYYRNLNGLDTGQVFVSSDGGATWNEVLLNVGVDLGAWNAPDQQSIDLTPYISNNMMLRFHYDDNNSWAWYWAVDNVHVFAPAASDAGVSAAVSPLSGGRAGTSTALSATEVIEVTIENFGGASISNIPVYYRINGVPTGPEMVAGPIPAGNTLNYQFTATADLSAPGAYTIDAWTALAGDGDMNNDTLPQWTINHVGNPAINLPFCADFEGATPGAVTGFTGTMIGAMGLDYLDLSTSDAVGRFRSNAGAGYPHMGNQALTMDIDPSGANTVNTADLVLNLSGYDANIDAILLDIWFMEHGDEVQPGDMFWVRGSDVDPWIVIGDWNTLTGGNNGTYFSILDFDLSGTLLGNGQNFSNTTMIRAGQEDNFPSTSLTASDGLTIDDICLRQLNPVDVQPIAMASPMMSNCGDSSTVVCAIFESLGVDTLFTTDITFNWSDDQSNTGSETVTWNDTVLFNGTDTVCFSPINTWNGGWYSFEFISSTSGDAFLGNDTLVIDSVYFAGYHTPMLDTVWACPGDSLVCITDMALDSNFAYNWFASDTASSPFYSGYTFCADSITSDTAFYVEAGGGVSFRIGAPDTTIGAVGTYSNYPDGLRFNATTDLTIEQFKTYPEGAGDITVRVLDNAMTVIATQTVTVAPATPFEPTYINVNLSVPAGTGYYLDLVGTTVTQVLRNSSGGVYPYDEPGIMDIYEAINQLGGYYYFFYDMRVSNGSCAGPRVCVPVMLNSDTAVAGYSFTTDGLDVMFTDTSMLSTGGWWDFGDGNTDSLNQNPMHTYAAAGTYQVCQYVWNDCTTDSICMDVTVCDLVTADFSYAANGSTNFGIDFTDLSTGPVSGWDWDFGDANTSTMQNPSHTYAGAGTFTVTLIVTNACGDSDTTSQVVTVVGLEEQFVNANVSIFPNPSTDEFNLFIETDYIENMSVELYDIRSQLVYTTELNAITGNTNHTVNIREMADGIYYLKLTVADRTVTKKVIKH